MFKNIKDRNAFKKRVEILWEDDYITRELEELPTTVFGGFAPWRTMAFLRMAKLHPEYHIVSCVGPNLYVNSFVRNAQTYFFAEGDTDSKIIHDPFDRLDASFLYSLSSGLSRFIA